MKWEKPESKRKSVNRRVCRCTCSSKQYLHHFVVINNLIIFPHRMCWMFINQCPDSSVFLIQIGNFSCFSLFFLFTSSENSVLLKVSLVFAIWKESFWLIYFILEIILFLVYWCLSIRHCVEMLNSHILLIPWQAIFQ